MDIDAALYPRRPIERIGIAPGTSMFYYDQSQRRLSEDWRPAIHDSDGLQLLHRRGRMVVAAAGESTGVARQLVSR